MANENKEIGDIVKKCKILLLDVSGTTTSISFAKTDLLSYAEKNVKEFLDTHWERDDVKVAVAALRKLALDDKEGKVDGVVDIPGEDASKDEQIEGLVSNVKWQISSDREAGPLKELQGLIWQQAYDSGDIKGHVYDDVSPALKQWRSVEGQKVYIYSSGSVLSQKLLFGKSLAGDLLPHIDGHFDVAIGDKREAASYTAIAEKIGCKPEEILYVNDMPKEAEVARSAGLYAALVSREGNAPLPTEATETYPVIHSFTELTVTNKRKQEPQDELPAKVPKTDTEDDVKTTTSETEPVVDGPIVDKETEQPEKMEVEETVVTDEKATEKNNQVSPLRVEEVTDEAIDAPVIEVEPIVEEKMEETETKTEEKQTEKMEVENGITEQAEVKNGDVDVPVPEETPPVITEIEDVSDKQADPVAEIIEDLEPVVEEPAVAEDMEELQNVGEVLEKECDEILSKVQDVTNLDNIPLKPLLNPIAEETMENDNVDSNDIVDRILDTELDLEMKQCADIDLNTVAEITDDTKTEIVEENGVKGEVCSIESNDTVVEAKVSENVEVSSDEKLEQSSTVETKVEEAKVEVQKTDLESKEVPLDVSPVTETETKAESKQSDVENVPVAEEVEPVNEVKSLKDEVELTVADVKPVSVEEDKSAIQESKPESDLKEPQLNGKATNGDAETVNQNGNASNDEELSSRLSVENGKEVNGSMGTEKGQGDSKVEADVADIKVKTVTSDEPRTDPVEQPTEA